MAWCYCLIVTRRFARISPSISWRSSSEIKDGLPLLSSSWTSVLPSENSRHHFVTFCRFIALPQTATICLWISARSSNLRWEIVGRIAPCLWQEFGWASPFQTRLTQTKPVLPLSNERGSQVKDQGRRQCCHDNHTIFPIVLHVMYLYFPDKILPNLESDSGHLVACRHPISRFIRRIFSRINITKIHPKF